MAKKFSIDTLYLEARNRASHTKIFNFMSLELHLALESVEQINWLGFHFDQFRDMPVFDRQSATELRKFAILGDDAIFDSIATLAGQSSRGIIEETQFLREPLQFLQLTPETSLAVLEGLGLAWYVEKSLNRITMIHTARCRKTLRMFGRTVKEIVFRHQENKGWRCYHAGAVQFGSDCFLVIGNANAGKTALIMSLCAMGGQYISNERTYLKTNRDNEVVIVGYPQPLNIRLSTGPAFPLMLPYMRRPETLASPQVRLKHSRIQKTPEHKWGKLEDKIVCFPHELVEILSTPVPTWGGKVRGIIAPRGLEQAVDPTARIPSMEWCMEHIMGNRLKRRVRSGTRPDWLRLSDKQRHDPPDEMYNLPTIEMEFHVREGVISGMSDPAQWLVQNLELAGHSR